MRFEKGNFYLSNAAIETFYNKIYVTKVDYQPKGSHFLKPIILITYLEANAGVSSFGRERTRDKADLNPSNYKLWEPEDKDAEVNKFIPYIT